MEIKCGCQQLENNKTSKAQLINECLRKPWYTETIARSKCTNRSRPPLYMMLYWNQLTPLPEEDLQLAVKMSQPTSSNFVVRQQKLYYHPAVTMNNNLIHKGDYNYDNQRLLKFLIISHILMTFTFDSRVTL